MVVIFVLDIWALRHPNFFVENPPPFVNGSTGTYRIRLRNFGKDVARMCSVHRVDILWRTGVQSLDILAVGG